MPNIPLTISVVIPCYQQAHYLALSINSLLSQTRKPDQIIVINDGSTDETEQVARGFGDRIIYFAKANEGLSSARNSGILLSQTDLILFLDSDDTLANDALESLACEFDTNPELDAVYGGYRDVDHQGNILTEHQSPELPHDPISLFMPLNKLPVHSVMIRRLCMSKCGVFDPLMRSSEDIDFWVRLALSGATFGRTSCITANYRRHPDTLSCNKRIMYQTRMNVCRKFVVMAKQKKQHLALARQSLRLCRVEEIVALTMVPFAHHPSLSTFISGIRNWLAMSLSRPIQIFYTFHAIIHAAKALKAK